MKTIAACIMILGLTSLSSMSLAADAPVDCTAGPITITLPSMNSMTGNITTMANPPIPDSCTDIPVDGMNATAQCSVKGRSHIFGQLGPDVNYTYNCQINAPFNGVSLSVASSPIVAGTCFRLGDFSSTVINLSGTPPYPSGLPLQNTTGQPQAISMIVHANPPIMTGPGATVTCTFTDVTPR
ncbi:MAG: hypothetical protein KIT27_02635 [Legionellales bacterium]|nr:hypothetical protein [Legionellales bacterium]